MPHKTMWVNLLLLAQADSASSWGRRSRDLVGRSIQSRRVAASLFTPHIFGSFLAILGAIEANFAIISQMAVHPKNQKQGIGSLVLNEMLTFLKTKNIKQIDLCARLTALKFYSQKGFKKFGKELPSKKTGVMHQNMRLEIKNVC